jgi:hypothetical protein
MIADECFSEEWHQGLRKRYPLASPQILEKTIYAIEFLSLLTRSGHPFVFKGGTALILQLPQVKRLSIDVDIVGDIPPDVLSGIIEGSRFTGMEEDVRRGTVPALHAKFFYRSLYPPHTNYVMLDMLRDDHVFAALRSLPLRRDELFRVDNPSKVVVPSLDELLGDKLTAFAPQTTGVLYGTQKSLEIIKQLFDIGELLVAASSTRIIQATFERVCAQQNRYRKTTYTPEQVLEDVIGASRLLCQIDLKGFVESSQTAELRAGMKGISSYLVVSAFSLPEAKIAAAKAAYIATVLMKGSAGEESDLIRFAPDKLEGLRDVQLQGELISFNKLKRTNPEAFYYWWLVSQMNKR